jgi:hypothetical protein
MAQISSGMPAKANIVCLNKLLVITARIVYPHETTTGIDFSGEMVMASTGQYIRHR